jgi:predicted nucleotidyltransferase
MGWKFFDLEDELAALFGRPVDLVSRGGISKHMRDDVLGDAKLIYAA